MQARSVLAVLAVATVALADDVTTPTYNEPFACLVNNLKDTFETSIQSTTAYLEQILPADEVVSTVTELQDKFKTLNSTIQVIFKEAVEKKHECEKKAQNSVMPFFCRLRARRFYTYWTTKAITQFVADATKTIIEADLKITGDTIISTIGYLKEQADILRASIRNGVQCIFGY